MSLVEQMYTELVETISDKKILQKPWPRFTYQEAMEEHVLPYAVVSGNRHREDETSIRDAVLGEKLLSLVLEQVHGRMPPSGGRWTVQICLYQRTSASSASTATAP